MLHSITAQFRPTLERRGCIPVRRHLRLCHESNVTTRRLAIRGIEADFGPEHADTFPHDLHPDLRADTATRVSAKPKLRSHSAGRLHSERQLLANPPFNDSDWFRKDDDVRWQFGVPPKGNANFAWVQHFINHLAPQGIAGFVFANGSMSSTQSGEGDIRVRLRSAVGIRTRNIAPLQH